MTQKSIMVDETTFNKVSKKLNTAHEPKQKLSETKELLSKAFGFRNYHALQSYFKTDSTNTTNITHSIHSSTTFNLSHLKPQEILGIFELLLIEDSWKDRSMNLLEVVLELVESVSKIDNSLQLNSDTIKQYIQFDKLYYSSYEDFISPTLKDKVSSYIRNLPGFQEGATTQNDTVLEQHGYNQGPILLILKKLVLLEQTDPILHSPSWTQEGSTQYQDKIVNSYLFEDSWLMQDGFQTMILHSLQVIKKDEDIYLSDLLLRTSKIINLVKRANHKRVLDNLLKNYNEVIKYSQRFSELVKE